MSICRSFEIFKPGRFGESRRMKHERSIEDIHLIKDDYSIIDKELEFSLNNCYKIDTINSNTITTK